MVRRACFVGALGALLLASTVVVAAPGGAGGAGGSGGGKTAGAGGESGGAGGEAGYAGVFTVKPGGTVAGKGSKTALLAEDCGGDLEGYCARADKLVWDKTITFSELDGIQLPDFDTGWILSGNGDPPAGDSCPNNCGGDFYCDGSDCLHKPDDPLDVRFYLKFPASTHVHMEGSLQTTWPDALIVAVPGARATGDLDFDFELKAGGFFHYGFSVFGDDFGNGDNGQAIPGIPDIMYGTNGKTVFDPYAFDAPVVAKGESPKITLFQIPLSDLILDVPGVSAGIELDAAIEVDVTYQSKQLVVKAIPDQLKPVDAVITTSNGKVQDDWQQGAWAEYLVHPEGTTTLTPGVHLEPSLYIEASLLGASKKFSIPVYDYEYKIPSTETDWTFDDQHVHVPLPDIRPPAAKPELDAPVVAGGFDVLAVDVTNAGEAALHIDSELNDGTFQVIDPHTDIDAGKKAAIGVRFFPKKEGDYHAVLRLLSNDPDTPELDVALDATSTPDTSMPYTDPPPTPPTTDPGDAGGGTQTGGSGGSKSSTKKPKNASSPLTESGDDGGCGCRVAGDDAPSAPALLGLSALALALTARRRGRSVPSNKERLS